LPDNNAAPFTTEEERLILEQLYELRRARVEIVELKEYIARDAEVDIQERENAARALELEKQTTDLARLETELYKDKANIYETLYRAVTAKPSLGCRIARVVTIGIYRCQ